ncbi:MAG: YbaB/EbfC family nucleoid-associated protein [Bdellovibrionales bacterium]|nr:YbaB/EbfC family nucleoid-associated protein [Bdellovibrionales bacterium]
MKGRGGFGGGGNMHQLMAQAKAMQAKMEKIQADLAGKTVEASSGGGVVRVVMSGKQEVLSLIIEKEAIEDADQETLQDMVKAAVNEALKKSQALSSTAMGGALGGLPIPPGLF